MKTEVKAIDGMDSEQKKGGWRQDSWVLVAQQGDRLVWEEVWWRSEIVLTAAPL